MSVAAVLLYEGDPNDLRVSDLHHSFAVSWNLVPECLASFTSGAGCWHPAPPFRVALLWSCTVQNNVESR